MASWLKSDARIRALARDTLLSTRAHQRGYFRREFIEDLFKRHDSTEAPYYGDALWTFLMVELWLQEFIDEPASVAGMALSAAP